ncbi:unnamed protein product [Brassica rapa subsp. narinosa]|uniref:(rape) hypothetical protein n=1 Tax=Brassica napus TaxID=3708 RepID=A0A816XUX0_BRANA|nr:unnamed protein product [Brassica napus]
MHSLYLLFLDLICLFLAMFVNTFSGQRFNLLSFCPLVSPLLCVNFCDPKVQKHSLVNF